MIKVNHNIQHPICDVYKGNRYIGTCYNDLQVNDVMIQCKEQGIEEKDKVCFLIKPPYVDKKTKVFLREGGRLIVVPDGFYDMIAKQRRILMGF